MFGRVLVIDDSEMARRVWIRWGQANGHDIAALDPLPRVEPGRVPPEVDTLVVGFRLGPGTSEALVRTLRAERPALRIVVYSGAFPTAHAALATVVPVVAKPALPLDVLRAARPAK